MNRLYSVASVAIVAVLTLFMSAHVVPSGHVGVEKFFGEIQPQVLPEGIHFLNPLSSVTDLEVRVRKTSEASDAGTKDLQIVTTEVTANYRQDGAKANTILKDFGRDIETVIIQPAIKESFKAVIARYTSEELITKREEVSAAISAALQSKVQKHGVIVSEISITNFKFSPAYQRAVETKVTAQQKKLAADEDLKRILVEGQQAVARAEAEAESLKAQKNQITPELLQLRAIEAQRAAIEKWDGKLPHYTGSAAVPFIQVGK